MHFNGARTVREPGCVTAEKRGGSGCGWRLLSPRNVSTVRTALGFSRFNLVGAEFSLYEKFMRCEVALTMLVVNSDVATSVP